MSESRQAFLVMSSNGQDYSDSYHAVFDDAALAEVWRQTYGGGWLERVELNPQAAELRAGLARWHVEIWRDGRVRTVKHHLGGAEGVPRQQWHWLQGDAHFMQSRGIAPERVAPQLLFECFLLAPDRDLALRLARGQFKVSVEEEEDSLVLYQQALADCLSWREVLALAGEIDEPELEG